MVYHSLFEQCETAAGPINFRGTNLHYSGNLEDVLNRTERRLRFDAKEYFEILDLILNPPRILRAIMDYKIGFLDSPEIERILRESVDIGLKIYSGKGTVDDITSLREMLIKTGNQDVLTRRLGQKKDKTTWSASHPAISEKTAKSLVSSKRGDLLFIALGHGGIAAGMDVFLRYKNSRKKDDSVFYPVRFSRNKSCDEFPQVTGSEISYLKVQSKGKKTVIFDEDTYTGVTLNKAREFFSDVLSPSRRIITKFNKVAD